MSPASLRSVEKFSISRLALKSASEALASADGVKRVQSVLRYERNLWNASCAARASRSVDPFRRLLSRRNNQLPEGNRACGSDIQGIYLVVHGDLHRVIAAGDGALGQAVAFRAQYERNLLAFL